MCGLHEALEALRAQMAKSGMQGGHVCGWCMFTDTVCSMVKGVLIRAEFELTPSKLALKVVLRAKVGRYSTVFPETFHTDEVSRESWAVHAIVQHNTLNYSTGVGEGKDNSTNTLALQYLLIGNDHIYFFTWVEVGKK